MAETTGSNLSSAPVSTVSTANQLVRSALISAPKIPAQLRVTDDTFELGIYNSQRQRCCGLKSWSRPECQTGFSTKEFSSRSLPIPLDKIRTASTTLSVRRFPLVTRLRLQSLKPCPAQP